MARYIKGRGARLPGRCGRVGSRSGQPFSRHRVCAGGRIPASRGLQARPKTLTLRRANTALSGGPGSCHPTPRSRRQVKTRHRAPIGQVAYATPPLRHAEVALPPQMLHVLIAHRRRNLTRWVRRSPSSSPATSRRHRCASCCGRARRGRGGRVGRFLSSADVGDTCSCAATGDSRAVCRRTSCSDAPLMTSAATDGFGRHRLLPFPASHAAAGWDAREMQTALAPPAAYGERSAGPARSGFDRLGTCSL